MINLLSLAYVEYSEISQCGISAGSAIICPTHKPSCENSLYKFGKKLLWVSAMCAQILGFSRVRVKHQFSLTG